MNVRFICASQASRSYQFIDLALVFFMVAPCINNTYQILQLVHYINCTVIKKNIKNTKAAPACFDSSRNHHQGAKVSA